MAIASYTIVIENPQADRVFRELESDRLATLIIPGCREVLVDRAGEASVSIRFLSWWNDDASLCRFLQSETQHRLLQYLELSVVPPEIMISRQNLDPGFLPQADHRAATAGEPQ